MKRDGNTPFGTSDLYLSAFLCAKGLRLQRLQPVGGGRVEFIFENWPDDGLLVEFAAGTAEINVGSFIRALRELKGQIYRRGGTTR